MGIVLGIDIGSSATKIVAMDESKTILNSLKVSASDPVTAMYGAVGKILCEERMQIADVEAVMLTGMGASYVEGDVYGLPTTKVTEFDALGTGGLYLTGLEETVVGSIGTGTVFVHAGPDGIQHIGGSAVGGGTLVGLSSRLFGIRDVEVIADMAEQGNLKNVDWGIAELSRDQMETLPDYATSSNLGKMKSTATDEDVALGLMNMIFQAAGTLAVFACRNVNLKKAVIGGSTATLNQARIMLGQVGELYDIDFIIPKQAAYMTAIGAAFLFQSK